MKKIALALLVLLASASACVGPADNASGPAPDAGVDDFVGGKGGSHTQDLVAPDAAPDEFLDPKGRGCSGSC